MVMQMLVPTIALGIMGLLFGAGLAFASKAFAVEQDPRIDEVRAALPGANCGACGFPGCDGFASAVVAGEAPVNGCPVCSPDQVAQVAAAMGVEAAVGAKKVATVLCQGDTARCKLKGNYEGAQDCVAAALVQDGNKACRYACLGLGTCAKVCPVDAITVTDDLLVIIDEEKCISCEQCVKACPKNVLRMDTTDHAVQLLCRAAEKGKAVREACTAGCIACGKCARSCKFDAIEMVDNLPKIDYEKCVGCMQCADNCPTKSIVSNEELRMEAYIDAEKCIGCGRCKKACQFEAIEGEIKEKHVVKRENCVGCGECVKVCKPVAITMRRQGYQE